MKKIIFISVIVATNALYSINIENATCKMFENGKLFRTEINAVSLYITKNDALLKSHKGEIL
ncbi:MAG: hypothetical protein FAF03_08665, partial [Epsilonproteobacteria bacterium]|nr:hypothetical protein [Campylobacterota bacterium]